MSSSSHLTLSMKEASSKFASITTAQVVLGGFLFCLCYNNHETMLDLQDIMQYGWMGYLFFSSIALTGAAWAIVPAKIAIRITKVEGKRRKQLYWVVYGVSFVVFASLLLIGSLVFLRNMLF